MIRMSMPLAVLLVVAGAVPGRRAAAADVDVAAQVKKIRAVGPRGAGHRPAQEAVRELTQANARQLPQVLAGMDGAGVLATNWLRGVVEAIVQRERQAGRTLPLKQLEQFVRDPRHAPRARRLAYEILRQDDPTAPSRIIPTLQEDPSLELRRDAIARLLATAEKQADAKKNKQARATYRAAFTSARDLDQIKAAAAGLKKLGGAADTASQMGFIQRWRLIGPFDNRERKGFNTPYPPERRVDLSATYDAFRGPIRWFRHVSKDPFGMVDLNKAMPKKFKGAVAYAYTEFVADKAGPCQLRLGCVTANKIWLNGKLLTANNVYHANTFLDQYIAEGNLRSGKNVILLKICQNEQEEPWAQRWQFQLRVCDSVGTAILSKDRPGRETASRSPAVKLRR